MQHPEREDFPTVYSPTVSLAEQMMLETIDLKSEGECEGTSGEGPFECICHYLGRPAYYHDLETFEAWMTEQPGSGNTFASPMARTNLTWENHGKWVKDLIPTKPISHSPSRRAVKVDTRYIYRIFFN
jgi:hypothetical protein